MTYEKSVTLGMGITPTQQVYLAASVVQFVTHVLTGYRFSSARGRFWGATLRGAVLCVECLLYP